MILVNGARRVEPAPPAELVELVIGRQIAGADYPVQRRYSFLIFLAQSVALAYFGWSAPPGDRAKVRAGLAVPIFAVNFSEPRLPERTAARRAGREGGGQLPAPSRGRVRHKPALGAFMPPPVVPISATPLTLEQAQIILEEPPAITQSGAGSYPLDGQLGGLGSGGGKGLGRGAGAGNGGRGLWGAMGRGIMPPKLLYRVEPEYTAEAKDSGYEGVLVLSGIIEVNGRAGRLRVVSGEAYGLGEAAIRAVQQWRFEPAKKDGRDYPLEVTIPVTFRLR